MTALDHRTTAAPTALHLVTQVDPDLVERRSRSALAQLSRQHDAVCTAAVDVDEIAAALEAEGMTDQACRRYGYDDVFSLAEALFVMVPRRAARPSDVLRRARASAANGLLRGVVYALPGLVGVGIGQRGGRAAAVLLPALALGWGWSQAVSYLGHRRLGWHGYDAACTALRRGLTLGLGLQVVVVLAAAWVAGGAGFTTVAIGLGLGWYMVAAGVLLVRQREWLLLAALVPGSVGGVLALLGAPSAGALAALTVLVTVVLAAASCRPAARDGGRPEAPAHSAPAARWVTGSEGRVAVAHLGHGTVCALIVGLGPSTLAALSGRPVALPWFVVLPLVLSMGPMEVELHRVQASAHRLLWQVSFRDEFARRAQLTFLRGFAGIVLVVTGIGAGCVVALTVTTGRADTVPVLATTAYGVLAGCFFVGLVLVAAGRVVVVVAALGAAFGVYLGAAALLGDPVRAYLGAFVALLAVLLVLGSIRARSPLVHV